MADEALTIWLTCDDEHGGLAIFSSEPEYGAGYWKGDGIVGVIDQDDGENAALRGLLGGKSGAAGIVKLRVSIMQ